ncbi:MAG: hypothetical protein ACEY26_00210 [Candidatus Hodgkinia cicadicola]
MRKVAKLRKATTGEGGERAEQASKVSPKKGFTVNLNFKSVLTLQALLLPNGSIPSRRMTRFSRKLQSKFASEVKKCRCLGLIPNCMTIAI